MVAVTPDSRLQTRDFQDARLSDVAKGKKRGRKRHVTLAVVQRVADRIAVGLTLELACEAEGDPVINVDSFHKALERHPEFVHPYHAAKADFLEWACERLVHSHEMGNLRWFLERRYSDLFGKPADTTINVVQQQAIVGISDEVLARARELSHATK